MTRKRFKRSTRGQLEKNLRRLHRLLRQSTDSLTDSPDSGGAYQCSIRTLPEAHGHEAGRLADERCLTLDECRAHVDERAHLMFDVLRKAAALLRAHAREGPESDRVKH